MGMPKNPTTKERILFAAIKAFARHGYRGATVRGICREAGTTNATAVNYYFGSKAKLYKTVLDMIFAENLKRRKAMEAADPVPDQSPQQRLRLFLGTMIDVGFSGDPLLKDVIAIVLQEMMSPSEHLDRLVADFVLPDVADFTAVLKDILGRDAPDHVVRDCMASVAGQIYYYMAFWPVFSRVHPEHPGLKAYKDPLLDHMMRFSMAGLEATRRALKPDIPPERTH